MQVPEESLKAVLRDAGGFGRSPDAIGLRVAIESRPEERVEARYVIHVAVREEEVIDRQDVAKRKFGDAPFAAVEEQPLDGLPAIDLDEQRIVAARFSEDTVGERHGENS